MIVDALHTLADDLWGRPCLACHVQPDLKPESQAAFQGLQRRLAEIWPDPLHVAPPEALHITIYPLVPVKGDFDKEAYWKLIAGPAEALLRELCPGASCLELRFFRLKVTDTAIIAVARDNTGLIEAIRNRIVAGFPPPPGGAPIRYNLIHTTLARYRSTGPVPASVVQRVENLPVDVIAPVEQIKLVRETLFPCLAVERIVAVPLRPRG